MTPRWLFPVWLGLATLVAHAQPPAPNSGLYAIWYREKYELLDMPYIVGGQIVVQWNDVEPQPHRYDFSSVAQELKKLRAWGEENHPPDQWKPETGLVVFQGAGSRQMDLAARRSARPTLVPGPGLRL